MTALFAWPGELKFGTRGVALTFVVPATSCNLRCSFCAIKQRREVEHTALSVDDYVYFLTDVAQADPLAITAVQGYEPLLPESWPYTSAIISAASRSGIPSCFVTNGVLLAERLRDIVNLNPTGVTVSLDSADPAQHDRVGGVPGAFEATLAGLRAIAAVNGFVRKLTVSSVLLPSRRRFLDDIPSLLAAVGVSQWVISPLLRIGKHSPGGPVGRSDQIVEDLLLLRDRATARGINVVLDDELGHLDAGEFEYAGVVARQFKRPEGLLRLTPSGACSSGEDILQQIGPHTPIWSPTIRPRTFIQSLLPNVMRSMAA